MVVKEEDTIVGILTERDIVRSCMNPDFDLYKTTALDISYTDYSVLNMNDPLSDAMELITNTKRRLITNIKFVKMSELLGDLTQNNQCKLSSLLRCQILYLSVLMDSV